MNELTLKAQIESIPEATAFVDELLEEMGCSMKAQMQIDIALDELLSNIANYAYAGGEGDMTVRVAQEDGMAVITFIDQGVPYNPLEALDPDTTLSAQERQIGGLGIFMVKKSMDEITYTYVYEHGQNVLTIKKKL